MFCNSYKLHFNLLFIFEYILPKSFYITLNEVNSCFLLILNTILVLVSIKQ